VIAAKVIIVALILLLVAVTVVVVATIAYRSYRAGRRRVDAAYNIDLMNREELDEFDQRLHTNAER
jgi:hypothetical protein